MTTNVVANNPFTGDWSCEISSPGDIASCKIPIKKDLPDTMRLKGNIGFMGNEIVEFDITLCEAFENEEFAKDLLNHGIPKGKFPQQCPAKAGMDYEISKYKFPKEKLPPVVIPDGDFSGDIHLYEPGKDPYATVHVEGKIFHELPKLPGFGR
ncbi:uncharacterized protein LOC103573730 isoform X2 [Microplitis demolitor]|nr:uncharacterized protein LOC103573730 isoform X2 [Microplitis demolitor]XP_053595805.1 uncharacterized protein LOC103573730 isoform X2 [Microplitis demolitor]XP_053595806.1 uncharacterized protein LOC103573730 isoform X2 [Microplitis demolitor]